MKRQMLSLKADQGMKRFLVKQSVQGRQLQAARPSLGTFVGLTDHVPAHLKPSATLSSDVAMHPLLVTNDKEVGICASLHGYISVVLGLHTCIQYGASLEIGPG